MYLKDSFYRHFINYPTYSFLTYLWNFGSLIFLFFLIQVISGIYLGMYYVASANIASAMIEWILREVYHGWFFRYIHLNGASFIFFFIYLHIFRNLYFGLFKDKFLWSSGLFLLILMMLTAFLGYVLPWGQMSFWAVTVITSFITVIPQLGIKIIEWIWAGFAINTWTLTRFYSFHYLFPFIIFSLIFLHIIFLHKNGSHNPLTLKLSLNAINFYPFFWIKDFFLFICISFFFIYIICFYPNALGHPDNYIEANSVITPLHIVPEWYFLFYYAILRIIPSKLYGILVILCFFLVLFLLPFLNVNKFNFNQNLYYYYSVKKQIELYSIFDLWQYIRSLPLHAYSPVFFILFWQLIFVTQSNVQNIKIKLFKVMKAWKDLFQFWFLLSCCTVLLWLGGCGLTNNVITLGCFLTFFLFYYFFFLGITNYSPLIWSNFQFFFSSKNNKLYFFSWVFKWF